MSEVLELRQLLRRERLLVAGEKRQIERLSSEIAPLADRTFQASWRVRHQQRCVDLLSSSQLTAPQCSQRLSQLDTLSFVRAVDGPTTPTGYLSPGPLAGSECPSPAPSLSDKTYPVALLGKYSELLLLLHQHPEVLARLIIFASSSKLDTRGLVETILGSVYGDFLVPEDVKSVLCMLERTMALQLATCEEPSHFLRGVSNAFTVTFHIFTEGFYGAHVYLSEVLGDVVQRIAVDDERYFEFECSKLATRFSDAKRSQLFAPDFTPKTDQVQRFLATTSTKLADYCSTILGTLIEKLGSLPAGLRWLLACVFENIRKRSNEVQAKQVLADLFFGQFICPAIANPELSIVKSNVSISNRARYNLTQVSRIIQSVGSAAITGEAPPAMEPIHSKLNLVSLNISERKLLRNVPRRCHKGEYFSSL